MSHDAMTAHRLWSLFIINFAVVIPSAYTFVKPQCSRDWRSFGAFRAFIVALFTKMYGVPLTIYPLSGWLQRRYPGFDPLSHDLGHLWWTLGGMHLNLGWRPAFQGPHQLFNKYDRQWLSRTQAGRPRGIRCTWCRVMNAALRFSQ